MALTLTITDALDKKQVPDLSCVPDPGSDLFNCVASVGDRNADTLCRGSCRAALDDYFDMCPTGREGYDLAVSTLCTTDPPPDGNGNDNDNDNDNNNNNDTDDDDDKNSAATVGVTVFTIVSAVLVAVGN